MSRIDIVAVGKEQEVALRLLLLETRNRRILRGMERSFPRLFEWKDKGEEVLTERSSPAPDKNSADANSIHKNWPAIARERDPAFRALLIAARDPRVVCGLAAGFPKFFRETPVVMQRVSVSTLRAMMYRTAFDKARDNDEGRPEDDARSEANFDWLPALEKLVLHIPLLSFGDEKGIPQSIGRQLDGERAGCGIPVRYRGGCYVVVQLSAYWRVGEVMKNTSSSSEHYVTLCPSQFIDTHM